jgi:hypothetical protein
MWLRVHAYPPFGSTERLAELAGQDVQISTICAAATPIWLGSDVSSALGLSPRKSGCSETMDNVSRERSRHG